VIDAGYFAKHVQPRPDWIRTAAVREICSVSDHISEAPDGWVDRWLHNQFGWFNRISDALGVVPEEQRAVFQVFAYRVHPEVFRPDGRVPLVVPSDVKPDPIPASFQSLGFDSVNKSMPDVQGFECSPHSCNGMDEECPVNEFCLFATLDEAIAGAVRFAFEQPEPGDYYVVEVLRAASTYGAG
jgi:hypothetical protein